ncbi:MAG: serine/threonine-protein phosphatase, partial [Bacteroidetes bacterium]
QKVILIANEVWQKGLSDPAYHGCGTTLSGVLVKGNAFHLVHVGDSRVYMLDRSNNLLQLTRDQTLVQRLMDQGQLSPEAAKTHPQRNVMYSAIGQEPSKISIDIRGPESIRQDELLLLCSDGIHDALEDEQLREILIEHKQNSALAEILVQAAYDAGGKDNITACWYRH